MDNNKLNILWTSGDEITSEKMVMMYGINAKINAWWDEVTIIIWGAPNKLIAESELIRDNIKFALKHGVKISACKACADQLETTELLLELGIEVKYWGVGLTEILKSDGKLLTV